MRIGELAKAVGIDLETVRYYEKQGLLPLPEREENGYRRYTHAHLERLSFIRHCRALDIPLADIQRLLGFMDAPASECSDINHLIDQHLKRVHARLLSMQALERQLSQLRACCVDDSKGEECGILHELVAAAHGEACACHVHIDQAG